jgi:phosphoglycerate dehydrogenase-like enzyme
VSLDRVAVTSRSFSRNDTLCHRLRELFTEVKFNVDGIKLTEESLVQFLKGATHAIIGLEVIDEALLSKLPELKVICKMGTGIDKIDLIALERRGISFSATPGINKRSVSELVLGIIFTIQRHLHIVYDQIKQGQWQQPAGRLLSNKTVGIIGFGAVGQDIATLLTAFGCQCLIYDLQSYENLMSHVSQVGLATLLSQSDIISLHLPLLSENYHFIGLDELNQMKKGAILINTARGGLVDEEALYEVLKRKHLSAAMDVFEDEPEVPEKLVALDNFFATSHIGGSTIEAIEAMGLMVIKNLKQIKVEGV